MVNDKQLLVETSLDNVLVCKKVALLIFQLSGEMQGRIDLSRPWILVSVIVQKLTLPSVNMPSSPILQYSVLLYFKGRLLKKTVYPANL